VLLGNADTFVSAGACSVQFGNCPRGTSAALDRNDGFGGGSHSEAQATPFGPVASVQGESTEGMLPSGAITPGLSASAVAEVDWNAMVVPVGAGLVLRVQTVPVTFTANVEATATGEFSAALAEAQWSLPGPGILADCQLGSGLPANFSLCQGISNTPGVNSLAGNAQPNAVVGFSVHAEGSASQASGFQASVDPVFQIADALIPGTDINFRDAFSVILSSDVTQSLSPATTGVPEPASGWLLVGGLAVLAALRRRRDRAPYPATI